MIYWIFTFQRLNCVKISIIYSIDLGMDLDPDPKWAKILDPDPNSMYLDP